MRRPFLAVIAALALPLAACGSGTDTADTKAGAKTEVASGTLTRSLGDAPGMTTVSEALKTTGLAGVFDGTAPYTILAPDDDAFGALGEAGKTLKTPENGAAMAALLKSHILPGYLTVADIDAALGKAQGKPVKMTTMAGDEVSFARDGDAIAVTAADGSTAKIDGQEVAASNGVAIPIGAVLKKVPAAG